MRSDTRIRLLLVAALIASSALPAIAADRFTPGKSKDRAKSYLEWRDSNGMKPLTMPPAVWTTPEVRPDDPKAAFDLDVLTFPTATQYSEYVDTTAGDIASRCTLVSKITTFYPPVGWTRLFTKRFDMSLASNETLGVSFSGQFNIDRDYTETYDGVYLLCTINPVDRYGIVDETKVAFCSTAQFFPNVLAQIPLTSQLISTSLHTFVTRPSDWADSPGTDVEMRLAVGTAAGMLTEACFMNLSVTY